jgi:hypothetical protein
MSKTTLHITNGSSLTDYLKDLDVKGDVLTWHEMLCEGPTTTIIDSKEFIEARQAFLNVYYDVEIDEYAYKNEIGKIDHIENYTEIVLWFEYDLFCHINLMAVINLLQQKKVTLPLYLVCSGRVKGEKDLKGLGELSPEQLLEHYKNKIKLNENDIDIATTVWGIYCGKDHNLLKPFIVKTSSFKYLNSCLKAHLKRFPDSKNGLSRLELHILETVQQHSIKSKHHLLGYILNYQGYYGFGDMQIERMIDSLSQFLEEENNHLVLSRKGHEAILGQKNFSKALNNDMTYGGSKRLEYQFNKEENKLIKTVINGN